MTTEVKVEKGNAFITIMRAVKALYASDRKKGIVDLFREEAGLSNVVNMATADTPAWMLDHVITIIKKYNLTVVGEGKR